MFTVALSGIRFHAPVGVYPQEALIHNELEIHISISQETSLSSLPFWDYETLYAIAKKAAREPHKLLESILQTIANEISSIYPHVKINIEIRKLHPPLGGEVAYSSVKWEAE